MTAPFLYGVYGEIMPRKKKIKKDENVIYSRNDSFENLEAVQQMALNRKGKDDEINPDISVFLKAEELKGKLCGLYADKEKSTPQVNVMGSVIINGNNLQLNVGEPPETGTADD
jgi:hypothetical protein